MATVCPDKKNGSEAAVKVVHRCEYRPSRSVLKTPSGERVPFLFDSGSSCSLLKHSFCDKVAGAVRKDLVYLSGIGGEDIQCTAQIQSDVVIDKLPVNLTLHVVSERLITDPIIVGRDIFDQGLYVKIDSDNLMFFSKKTSHYCDLKPN